jgi:TIR domain/Family of unknown function (DUF5670)
VTPQAVTAFVSYSREDSEFVLRLAQDLKAADASIWLDQLDIPPGKPWDDAIEDALKNATYILVILSPHAVRSKNVKDEIDFGLRASKTIIPVLYIECDIPLRLGRTQHIDFRPNYASGIATLIANLQVPHPNPPVLYKAVVDPRPPDNKKQGTKRSSRKPWVIACILFFLWIFGFLLNLQGMWIHLLLILAILCLISGWTSGRRA